MVSNRRIAKLRIVKILFAILALAVLYVLLDFMVDIRPPNIHSSYHFTLKDLPVDQPLWLRQDNLTILLVRRSSQMIRALEQSLENLQDPQSDSSRQPVFARNLLRSRHEAYFVAYGGGTDLGCPLKLVSQYRVGESCGTAQYDFAGRAIVGQNRFQNLTIPDYTFSHDFSVLTVNP